jgi:hypothetical protein
MTIFLVREICTRPEMRADVHRRVPERLRNTFFSGTRVETCRAFALFWGYPDWIYGSSDRIASSLLRLGLNHGL